MANVVKVKTLELGIGRPKVAVSITGRTKEQFLKELQMVLFEGRSECTGDVDLIEIRMDSFASVDHRETVETLLKELREFNPDIPFLFTFRSKQEGGEGELSKEGYRELLFWAARSGKVDVVDIEALHYQQEATEWIRQMQSLSIPVIASYHDVRKTPADMDMILQTLSRSGGDIVKLAVMANSEEDVRRLVKASKVFADSGRQPIISMAMGDLGSSTRVKLSKTGSALTFGAIGSPSAPGQIPVRELITLINRHEER